MKHAVHPALREQCSLAIGQLQRYAINFRESLIGIAAANENVLVLPLEG